MRNRLTTVSLAALVMLGAAADDHFFIRTLVPADSPSSNLVPVSVDFAIADLCTALQVAELPLDTTLRAAELLPDNEVRGLLAQINRVGDDRARVYLLLPPHPAGEREIVVYLADPPANVPAPEPLPGLQVRARGSAFDVVGAGFTVTHDPAKLGGLPSAFSFGDTGKTFDSFVLNDRVHKKGVGSFYLRNDPEPQVALLAAGPLCVEVQVRARYWSDRAPETHPRATYNFRYYAGSPLIEVSVAVEQDAAFEWNELHLLEINFKDDTFPRWAVDDPAKVVEFADTQSSNRGSRWGALTDGSSVLGMIGPVIIYDHAAGYGRYLHGPWDTWSSPRTDRRLWLWLGTGAGALQRLDADARAIARPSHTLALSPRLAHQLGRLSELVADYRAASDGRRDAAGALQWRVALLQSALDQGVGQMPLLAAAEALSQAAQAGPGAILSHVPALPGGRLALKQSTDLGVGLRLNQGQLELVSLYRFAGGEMLARPCSLFSLVLSDAEGQQVIVSTDDDLTVTEARGLEEGEQAVVRFDAAAKTGLTGLHATLTMTISAGGLALRLAVDNDTQYSLEQVVIPDVTIGALGDPSDDMAYAPRGFGVGFPNPTGGGVRYLGYYPSGGAVVQFLAMTDRSGGVYVAAHDPTACTKNLRLESDGSCNGLRMWLEIPAPDASRPGNDFQLDGEAVIAAVGGGWWPATQLYRRWLAAHAPWWPEPEDEFSRSDRPPWLDDISIWALTGGTPEQVVAPVKAFAEYMGLPTAVHWYNWHQIPFDNDYPHYFPTKEGFAEGVAELQAAGVRVVPYINGRLWDTDTADFATDGIRWCTKNREGQPYIEEYGSKQKLAPMCPTQEPWREILYRLVLRLVDEVGVDGVYMDQIAAARAVLCYDAAHGHPLAGGHWWVDGYWQLLGRLQSALADISPEKMLTTESNAEPYAKWFDTYLMCNSMGDGLVPIFPAVYGGKMLMFGRYMSAADFADPNALAQKQGQLFVWGAQLWWSQPQVINHPAAAAWLRDLARVRHQVREFFNHGRMLAPPDIEPRATVTADWHRRSAGDMIVTTDAVLAAVWQGRDGRVLVPLVNCSGETQDCKLRLATQQMGWRDGATIALTKVTPNGTEQLPAVRTGEDLRVPLAPHEVCALLLTSP